MIILYCCIIIFITYLAICSLLTYYFIKHRLIWDELFSLESLKESMKDLIIELIMCPEHFIIWLPFCDFENTKCVEQKKMQDDYKLNIKKILEHIKNKIVDIKDIGNDYNINNINNKCNINKIKWIVEGTMKDFYHMYDENAEFYNKLAGSYDILYNKMNLKHNNTCLLLEDLVILENNIEVCENILNILSIFYIDDYKLLFQIESGYMSLFIYNLIENIRMYKIMCMSKF